jgi:DNA-binding NarL/FixJ family response regulator
VSANLAPSPYDDVGGTEPPPGHLRPNRKKRPARVLIVEDEWLVSMTIEAALEQEGFEAVGIAASAEEAIRMAELHRPDLILMDIRLNGPRDGVEAAQEIHRRFGLRCLFVSAHRDPATQERAQSANPLGWVSKPFSDKQLVKAVTAALRRI